MKKTFILCVATLLTGCVYSDPYSVRRSTVQTEYYSNSPGATIIIERSYTPYMYQPYYGGIGYSTYPPPHYHNSPRPWKPSANNSPKPPRGEGPPRTPGRPSVKPN